MSTFKKNNPTGLEIAIIGMAGRFPGASHLDEFWENLKNGVESISFFCDQELSDVGVETELLNSPNYIKARGVVWGTEYFDSLFFGYIPVEVELMDPQIRIFHECAWEALESGGYVPGVYKGRIGVYAGASSHLRWEFSSFISEKAAVLGDFAAWQLYDKDFMSTRLAYNLNLSGPGISVHTACSTSLVAIHLACQGLLSGECHLALAGGITLAGRMGYLYQPGMILSPDGHCRAFASDANGTVFSEGVGVVLLKPLEKALAQRDTIWAVIKSSAINNDGKGKVGYTAPSVKGQAAVIKNAHRLARTKPETITYLETHGTGTNLGDPVEMEALIQAFNTDKKGFCRIGSVKSNIGHTDVVAGVAGFIKAVLALKYKMIPPTLHVEQSNPKVDFENSPFVVNTSLVEWKSEGFPLRAGVSSFGAGGTNAHAILEEAPAEVYTMPIELEQASRQHQLILLSAKTETALERMRRNLAAYLRKNPGISIGDVAYTLQAGRQAFEYRRMLLCRDTREAAAALAHPQKATPVKTGKKPVIFMFPGQGSQYVKMGLDLYREETVFQQEMDRCFDILRRLMDYDIKEILYPGISMTGVTGETGVSEPGEASSNRNEAPLIGSPQRDINQTEVAQPLIFAIEYALSKLLMSWGIKPYAMIGHSIGEYTAACTAGVFSLENALEIVVLRGRLMQKMPPGAMVSVPLSKAEILPLLTPGVSLAAINTPGFCVVSGPFAAIDNFSTKIKERGHETRPLHTSHAFHSEMMNPILNQFEKKISRVTCHEPRVPYISNLTGNWIRLEDAASPRYWAKHLREPVLFSDGLTELLKRTDAVFLEIGPGKALSTFTRQHPDKKDSHGVIELLRHPRQNEPDDRFLADKIGRLWLCGVEPDWKVMYQGENRKRVPLPAYSFERQYFPGPGASLKIPLNKLSGGTVPQEKKKEIAQWFYQPSWEKSDLPLPKTVETLGKANWLVFIDMQGVGIDIVKKIVQSGQHVTVVKAGDGFNRLNDREFTVNPRHQDDYERLFAEFPGSKQIPRQILHLWGVTGNKPGKEWQEEMDDILDLGYYSLLNIARAIGSRGIKEDIQIGVVTDNMQEVSGIESLCPGKAVVLGAVQVIPREYKNIRCCGMDILLPEPGSQWEEKMTDHLIAEFAEGFPENIVAYRWNHRWLPVVKPVPFNAPGDTTGHLKKKGVYLVTGGSGGIGLTLAGYLAKSVGARLILVGRSPFPARDEWESWLSDRVKSHRTSIKIRKLMEIENAGGEVLVVSGDVSNLERMQEIVALARERYGGINGVIHAAGIPDGALIQRRTREMTEAVFASKIRGTLVLDHIFKDEPLDFFVLCSSLTSILVPIGQVGYGAANAFLDAFALYKASNHKGRFTAAINWDAWRETGMAVDAVKKLDGSIDIPDLPPVKTEHPLFDYSLEKDSHEKIYVSHFSVKNFWVLDEHRLIGKPTLPGTACVEMARAVFVDHTGCEFSEFSEIDLLTPLRLEENEEKEVHTVLNREGDGFRFVIKSRGNRAGDKWEEHAVGDIGPAGSREVKKHDIKKIMARCSKAEIPVTQELLDSKERTDNLDLVFGPRWNNLRLIYAGENETLLLLELPEEYRSDTASYKLHPALLDNAVGYYNAGDVDREASLPFSYKGLKVTQPLPGRIYSHLRYDGKKAEGEKILTYSITLMDEDGVELVSIEEYNRLTVSGGAMDRLSQTVPAREERLLEHGLLNSEGIEVFRRIMAHKLPQVIVSTKDFAELAATFKTPDETIENADFLEEIGVELQHRGALRPRPVISQPYTAPTNEIEKKIVETWQNFLGIEPVGIHDDFFELGGDSLKVITVAAKIHKSFDVEISPGDFFNKPTPAGISGYIKSAEKVKYLHIWPVEKKEFYPLSSAQERMYFLQQLDVTSVAYNMTLVIPLGKDIDRNKLEWTARNLIARHEGFRTSFVAANEITVQRIHDHVEFEIQYYDASQVEQVEGQVEDVIRNFVRPFDLSKVPLIRSVLIKVPSGDYKWIVDIHHIISDGISLEIISGDLKAFYLEEFLPALRIQYRDFSEWQNREKDILLEQEKFWKKEFAGEIPVLELPTDYPRPTVQSYEGSKIDFEISPGTTGLLKALAVETGTTLFMALLAIYTIFISKITNQEDILVGTPVAGRSHADLEKVIGIFVNTLVMRNYPSGEKTVSDFIRNLKENTLKAIRNQDYQYEYLVEQVAVNRDFSRNPLFDTMLVLRSGGGQASQFSDLIGMPYEYENETSKFDLTLTAVETGEKLLVTFEYCIKLFKRETVKRFITYFRNILKGVLDDKEQGISHLEIITEEEKKRILFDFNDTGTGWPEDKTIRQLFEEQVKQTPDNIAVSGEAHKLPGSASPGGTGGLAPLPVFMSLTYRELNKLSAQLAGLLIKRGIQSDTIVGIMAERSIEMIIGIMGILKAGGAYLPVDPEYPAARINYMLSESGTRVLVTTGTLAKEMKKNFDVILLEPFEFSDYPSSGPLIFSPSHSHSSNLAYIIYTSGTTGRPKGALIEHRNVVRLFFNDEFQFDFCTRDTWTMFHSICFDFSVWEMYGALLYGGKLVIISRTLARDSWKYLEILKKEKVTILNQTPSAFYNLMNLELMEPQKELYIRYVVFGGEALTPSRLKGWKTRYPGTKLINMYGITETTVHVTFKEIREIDIDSTASNIGKPIPTLSTYVLDNALKLLPVGIPGELCVGGKGVGRGYLNRPGLTADKFTDNPYAVGEKLYRSGDLVKVNAGGEIEYLGRIDNQVKIRGFRIETGEIAAQLVNHQHIKEAVVLAKTDKSGDCYLCAYIVPDQELPVSELRGYLGKCLPDYMIPAYFEPIEKIPLTANGKIDRKALPGPGLDTGRDYLAPRDEPEKKLAEIWGEVLGIPGTSIGISDNFFELGGHSLKAITMVSKIHKELYTGIPLVEVFRTPTIMELSGYIRNCEEVRFASVEPVEKKEYYMLSAAQEQLYTHQQMAKNNIGYNVSMVVRLEGKLHRAQLGTAFENLIKRHENLRTSFVMYRKQPTQRIHDQVRPELEYFETKENPDALIKSFIRPFDLARVPLVRMRLVKSDDAQYILMLDIHHIITDGPSMEILVRELMALYNGEELPVLKVHYKDFSHWQNKQKESENLELQEKYWLQELKGNIPKMNLPIDYARPAIQDNEGNTIQFDLGNHQANRLKQMAVEQVVTLNMILLTLFNILLSKHCDQEELIIGTPIAGRKHADLEPIIGFFVNMLALHNYPGGEKTFLEFLIEVKEKTLMAYANQDYQFENLVDKLLTSREAGRNALIDVVFASRNIELLPGMIPEINLPGLRLIPYEYNINASPFDLILHSIEAGGKLSFLFQYRTKVFKESTIRMMIQNFKEVTAAVIANPNILLRDIAISHDLLAAPSNIVRDEQGDFGFFDE